MAARAAATRSLLDLLGSGSVEGRNRALTLLLREHGIEFRVDGRGHVALPAGGPVNRQPASLVQAAATNLLTRLDAVLAKARTDDDLRALFTTIVRRREYDAMRRLANRAAHLGSHASVAGCAPVQSIASRLADEELRSMHVRRLVEAASGCAHGGEVGRGIVEKYVIEGLDWPGVARALDAKEGALKVRLTRMRPELLRAVYSPFVASLAGRAASVADALLVEGKSARDAGEMLGLGPEEVRAVLEGRVIPAMRDYFGAAFLEFMPRLQRRAARD